MGRVTRLMVHTSKIDVTGLPGVEEVIPIEGANLSYDLDPDQQDLGDQQEYVFRDEATDEVIRRLPRYLVKTIQEFRES